MAFPSPSVTTTSPTTGVIDEQETQSAEAPAPEREETVDTELWGVVLAGGIGSRFWPLSTPERPKPLLALISERPLIRETIDRLQPLIPPNRVLVVTSADIAPGIAAVLPDVPASNILVEPRPLGTAAAVAWAADMISRRAGPEAVFACVHADLAIGFPDAFRDVLREGARIAARENVLVAIGVEPTRTEPGFGYIQPGAPLSPDLPRSDGGACWTDGYAEKPPRVRAEELIFLGALWNAGIYVWRVRVLMDALREHAKELSPGLASLEGGEHASFAESIESISIERGLLERCDRLVVLPGEFEWDDVGTWASLRRARELDDNGNGAFGRTHFHESSGNIVHAEASSVVLYGVSSLLVVSVDGLTFVTTVDKATDLRSLIESLPTEFRQRR